MDVTLLGPQAVSHLRSNSELIDENFLVRQQYENADCYLRTQLNAREWVDELMLRAVSCCLGRDIHVLHDNGFTTILQPATSASLAAQASN